MEQGADFVNKGEICTKNRREMSFKLSRLFL